MAQTIKLKSNQRQIYLAAPLFTQGEKEFNSKVYKSLKDNNYEVFLPQKECEGLQGENIYKKCLLGLQSSSLVVAILDGPDADSGTAWECGYAVSQGIPVIAVRTDLRHSGDIRGFNAMLYYSASKIVEGSNKVIEEIVNAIQVLES
jgi:nucleoside 2-deoxyribosyltransferase